MRRKIMRRNEMTKKDIDDVLRVTHDEREIMKFTEFVLPRVTETIQLNGTSAMAELGVEVNFDVTNPNVVKWIKKRCGDLVKGILDTTKDKLRKTLAEGIEAGESIPHLASRVSAVYDEAKGSRAIKIARTETVTASNEGSLAAYRQSGIIEKKEWLAAGDACADCAAMNGEVVKLNDNFSGGVSAPSLHPNCRCAVLPVIKE